MTIFHTTTPTDAVRAFVLENFLFTDDAAALADDESFLEKGILDSTRILELILFVEDEFGIKVPDEDMVPENFDSIAAVASFVDRKMGG